MPHDYQYISNSIRVLDPTKLFDMLSYYGSIPRHTSTSCRSGHDIKGVPFYDSEVVVKRRRANTVEEIEGVKLGVDISEKYITIYTIEYLM